MKRDKFILSSYSLAKCDQYCIPNERFQNALFIKSNQALPVIFKRIRKYVIM